MALEEKSKNYGGNNGSLDVIRLRFGAISPTNSVMEKATMEPDCVTCNRSGIGHVLTRQKCAMICGIIAKPVQHRYLNNKLKSKKS